MSSTYNLKMSAEQAKEMPMVDLAFEILKSSNITFYYRDLMFQIAKIKGLSEADMMQVIAQLYTEINIDGRFACVGGNMWGLKRWYPVEKSDDGVGGAPRPRIINDDDFGDEEEDYTEEEEEETFAEEEDYDSFDHDAEFTEEEEEEEFFDDDEVEEDAAEEGADGVEPAAEAGEIADDLVLGDDDDEEHEKA